MLRILEKLFWILLGYIIFCFFIYICFNIAGSFVFWTSPGQTLMDNINCIKQHAILARLCILGSFCVYWFIFSDLFNTNMEE